MMKTATGAARRVGLFTAALLETWPWLPVEEDGRLHDPVLRENFVERVFALHELNTLRKNGLTRRALLDFHSRYKPSCWRTIRRVTVKSARSLPRCTSGRPGRLLCGVPGKADDHPEKTRFAEESHQRADAYSGVFS
jgi:hypothetical protein